MMMADQPPASVRSGDSAEAMQINLAGGVRMIQERLEEQLQDSESNFKSWFDDAPVACHEIDTDGVVLRVNPAWCALVGLDPAETLGHCVWEFMAPEEREKSRDGVRRTVSGQRMTPFEREYKRPDGTTVILEVHPHLMRNRAGKVVGIRSFMLDVTARKRAEQELQKQADKLARSNSELEQFAYVASHDLQEPLRKIQAFGDRLKNKSAAALTPDGADDLMRIQNAAARMQVLIQDLLCLSRITSHARPFVAVDLAEVAAMVVSDLEIRIQQSGARVEVGPLPVIDGDRMQMAQLMQNIIGNAIKFHKPNETPVVKISGELIRGQNGAGFEHIMVEDNGIGFDEKYLDRIFQIFQRLHGRNEYEGTGIGLAICRKIAELHGGTITARSAPGGGAKFIIALPAKSLEGRNPA
jgi:PAS domain S-box-containing protein